MSQKNLELAQRMIEWFNASDPQTAQAHSTDDVEIVPLRAAMEGTAYRGPDAFATFARESDEAWEETRFDPERFATRHERVVAIGHLLARARGMGAELDASVAIVFQFRGDKLSRVHIYSDVDKALEAAGLSE